MAILNTKASIYLCKGRVVYHPHPVTFTANMTNRIARGMSILLLQNDFKGWDNDIIQIMNVYECNGSNIFMR